MALMPCCLWARRPACHLDIGPLGNDYPATDVGARGKSYGPDRFWSNGTEASWPQDIFAFGPACHLVLWSGGHVTLRPEGLEHRRSCGLEALGHYGLNGITN